MQCTRPGQRHGTPGLARSERAVALVGMFVLNRLDYASLRDGNSPSASNSSMLDHADDSIITIIATVQRDEAHRARPLRRAAECCCVVAAEATQFRAELEQAAKKGMTASTDKLQLDIDELRGPVKEASSQRSIVAKKRRRRHRRAQAARKHATIQVPSKRAWAR